MRLFVALDIPEDVRKSLVALAARLRVVCPDARWVRMEGVHVTLKFIGETTADGLSTIQAALASLPPRAPIPIKFHGTGFFPNPRRPRVLWAGVKSGPELATLAGDVESALAAVGIPREERAFSPHLTLARLDEQRGMDSLRAAIEQAGPMKFGSATAENFHLYQSVLRRDGAEYTRLATYSFTGSKTE